MLCHAVMFKLKDSVACDDTRVTDVMRQIERLANEIETVEKVELGWDLSRKKHSFDYATLWHFKDQSGLDYYSAHPAHLKVLEATRDIFDVQIADFEADASPSPRRMEQRETPNRKS